jgi:ankyrin repeat protein
MVALLIQRGADVNSRPDYMCKTSLMQYALAMSWATSWTQPASNSAEVAQDMVERLISGGADVNALDWTGANPLHNLLRFGSVATHRPLLELLMEHQPEVVYGPSTMLYDWPNVASAAMRWDDVELVQRMINAGADICATVRNINGAQADTALHRWVMMALCRYVKNLDRVDFLVGEGVQVDAFDRYGITALGMVAAMAREING